MHACMQIASAQLMSTASQSKHPVVCVVKPPGRWRRCSRTPCTRTRWLRRSPGQMRWTMCATPPWASTPRSGAPNGFKRIRAPSNLRPGGAAECQGASDLTASDNCAAVGILGWSSPIHSRPGFIVLFVICTATGGFSRPGHVHGDAAGCERPGRAPPGHLPHPYQGNW